MTIEKHQAWGEPWHWPTTGPEAGSDAELAALAAQARAGRQGELPAIVLRGGDLLTTLGGVRAPGEHPLLYPCDLGYARLDDGIERPFVAHAIARRRWWRGPFLVAMNAAHWGELRLGPRAHPNDAKLDLTWGSLSWQQRLLARRRARSGSHLPHPELRTARVLSHDHDFARRTPVYLDGVAVGRSRSLALRIVADAFAVIA